MMVYVVLKISDVSSKVILKSMCSNNNSVNWGSKWH
jgi:hypothetical protein